MSTRKTKKIEHESSEQKVKTGLGGWLIVVCGGLIISTLIRILSIFDYIGVVPELNTIAISGFAIVLQIEFLIEILYIVASIYLLYLFFKKHKKFPTLYVIYLWSLIAWATVDYFLLSSLTTSHAQMKQILDDTISQSSRDLFKTCTSSIIWILYMHRSRRVKATFVKE